MTSQHPDIDPDRSGASISSLPGVDVVPTGSAPPFPATGSESAARLATSMRALVERRSLTAQVSDSDRSGDTDISPGPAPGAIALAVASLHLLPLVLWVLWQRTTVQVTGSRLALGFDAGHETFVRSTSDFNGFFGLSGDALKDGRWWALVTWPFVHSGLASTLFAAAATLAVLHSRPDSNGTSGWIVPKSFGERVRPLVTLGSVLVVASLLLLLRSQTAIALIGDGWQVAAVLGGTMAAVWGRPLAPVWGRPLFGLGGTGLATGRLGFALSALALFTLVTASFVVVSAPDGALVTASLFLASAAVGLLVLLGLDLSRLPERLEQRLVGGISRSPMRTFEEVVTTAMERPFRIPWIGIGVAALQVALWLVALFTAIPGKQVYSSWLVQNAGLVTVADWWRPVTSPFVIGSLPELVAALLVTAFLSAWFEILCWSRVGFVRAFVTVHLAIEAFLLFKVPSNLLVPLYPETVIEVYVVWLGILLVVSELAWWNWEAATVVAAAIVVIVALLILGEGRTLLQQPFKDTAAVVVLAAFLACWAFAELSLARARVRTVVVGALAAIPLVMIVATLT